MPFLDKGELSRRLRRHAALLRHGLRDGPLVKMATWQNPEERDRLTVKQRPPEDDIARLTAWWMDPKLVVPRTEETLAARVHYGDMLPLSFVNLGPGALAAFMGCRSIPQATTIWQEELIHDWATAPELRLREDSFCWKAAQAITKESIAAAQGRWITTFTDIGGAMDITSYFRGPENLCADVVEHPDEVRRSEEAVLKAWFQVYDRLYAWLKADCGGSSGWLGLWLDGRTYPLQCDFSCMISPAMFRDFALPILHRQAAGLDVAIYHLDGPGAIRHLDALCEIPNLNVIQWVPGAGHSHRVADWLDLYRRIQDHGRAIEFYCAEEDLPLVFRELDVDRLSLSIPCSDVAQGERIMATIDRLRAGRKKVQ